MSFSRKGHANLSSTEIADRLAFRELLDVYAHCTDRRDIEGHMSLFTADTEFLLFDGRSFEPTQSVSGRDALRPLFDELKTYETTTHFNGQSTVVWEQNSASGVLNCLAHLVKVDGASRTLTISCVRYFDQFVKQEGFWYLKQRKAMLD